MDSPKAVPRFHAYESIPSSSSSSPVLPTTRPGTQGHSRSRSRHYHKARSRNPVAIAFLAFVPIVSLTAILLVYHLVTRLFSVHEYVYGLPDVPEYDEYYTWEDRLPQHNASREYPEGPEGRYVKFSNQIWGYGLNNQLQEILLLSHISYLSHRAYVFQPYTWSASKDADAVLDGRNWRSSRIPLSVFIAGPTAGGAFAEGDPTPRAVNNRWWERVCPLDRRKVVDVSVEHAHWNVDYDTEGQTLVDLWSKRLREIDDECIEVVGPTIFDFPLIASPRILSIWKTFSTSPILTRFTWSGLVAAAVDRNLPLFRNMVPEALQDEPPLLPDAPRDHAAAPALPVIDTPPPGIPVPSLSDKGSVGRNHRRPPSPILSSMHLQSTQAQSEDNSSSKLSNVPRIKGLLAVHLRRGDFKMHCHTLADRVEPFAGWNQFPYLLDRFTPPEKQSSIIGRGRVHTTYVEHCWPEIEQIVRRLWEVRRLHPGLERVFILTNGKKDWVDKLKRALLQGDVEGKELPEVEADSPQPPPVLPGAIRVQPIPPSTSGKAGWKAVYTSKDMDLLWTEHEVDQAIDMEIARRAEVFLGNGFSSLTSNIVMLRLADSSPIENIRFW